MEIEFQGFYSWKDLVRAAFMASKPPLRKRLFRIVIGVLAIGLFLAYVIVVAGRDQDTLEDALKVASRIFTFSIILFYMAYPYIDTFLTAKRIWKAPYLHVHTSGIISSQGVSYTGNASMVAWDRFAKKEIISNLIVLLGPDGILCFFPRDFFKSDADWQRAIQLINFRVVEAKQ